MLDTHEFTYTLPPEKIAFYPLPQRDASKLLVYDKGRIIHSTFRSLPDHLPDDSFLFFNDTRVIPARLLFQKESGATIEIFLLNPLEPSSLLSETMISRRQCRWQCTIGNLKKWPGNSVLRKSGKGMALNATLVDRAAGVVDFSWQSDATFAEVISQTGDTPLPPYIKRKVDATDAERYQTVYAHAEGAVAAPTAGLHFTPAVMDALVAKDIHHSFVTLHVSAGTFQPIKTSRAEDHVMHQEQIVISRKNVEHLLHPGRRIIAVGTTSMRTLESVYWYGAKILRTGETTFRINQDDPYTMSAPPPPRDAFLAVAERMNHLQVDHLTGETSIYIRPGYTFRVCQGLITNFHQPASTLMLLVAAFVGPDWRRIYDEALQHDYRFLSYGDSSLLMPDFGIEKARLH